MPTSHVPKLFSSGRVSSSLPELIQTWNGFGLLDSGSQPFLSGILLEQGFKIFSLQGPLEVKKIPRTPIVSNASLAPPEFLLISLNSFLTFMDP
jgi:hypothetical protein